MKLRHHPFIALLLAASLFAAQACSFFTKSDFLELKAADLTTYVDAMPEMQKRQLAQNQQMRKGLIDQLKTPFSLAQAAEAEGLQKTDSYKQELTLATARVLATEFTKRNPDLTVAKEEWEGYYNAHKAAFDADFAVLTKNAKQAPSNEDKESLRAQWSELMLRADRGRQAGLEKDPLVIVQLKFYRANVLANAYSRKLEEQFKMTETEKQKYISEHPEADVDKLKQKAQTLLDRVKKGESFEKVADEFNEDDTKGRGGDLEWGAKEKWVPEFSNAAFALQPGQVSEVVKSPFGLHIIKVDEKRTVTPTPSPTPAGGPNVAPAQPPAAKPEPREEVHARHIFISTEAADTFEQTAMQEKVKRALEDATLKYPVKLPADFQVNVAGYDPNRMPGLGGGQSGTMKGIDPNANK